MKDHGMACRSVFAAGLLLGSLAGGCQAAEVPELEEQATEVSPDRPIEDPSSLEYEVSRAPDGPFAFKILSVNFNEGSTLQRESIVLNTGESPVAIRSNALKFDYKERRFRYNMTTSVEVSSPVTALEIRHLLFDIFGQHLENLNNTEAADIPAGPRSLDGTWNILRENRLSKHLTTVTYVSRARLADGRIWKADFDQVRAALGTLNLERIVEKEEEEE